MSIATKIISGVSLITLLLSGCASKYSAPTNVDTASVRIQAEQFSGFSGVRAVFYKNGDCDQPSVLAVISGMTTTKSDLTAGIPEQAQTNAYVDRLIEASGTTNITIKGYKGNYYCSLPVAFPAQPNQSYKITYYWSEQQCHVEVEKYEKRQDAQVKLTRVPATKQLNGCLTGFSGPAL